MAPPYPPNPYSGLPKGSTSQEAQLYDSGGPFWWRGLAEMQDEQVVCGWAKELQDKIGARRIIGGHTPNFEKIVDRCNSSIIIIDTGAYPSPTPPDGQVSLRLMGASYRLWKYSTQ